MPGSPPLRDLLHERRPALGLWAAIPSSLTAEAAAATGADYVVVDQQHGAVDPAGMMAMLQAIQAAGAAPMVRVGRNDPWAIGHALDLGAAGAIVPMVDDAAQAAAAVSACRYAPQGERSFGRVRGEAGAASPVCLVMVETRAGLESVEEIARTPGLDGVYVGPSDLALSLGLQPTPRLEHPPVLEAIERIRAACDAAGVVTGLHCLAAEDAARYAGAGFGLITAGADLLCLRAQLAHAMATARGEGPGALVRRLHAELLAARDPAVVDAFFAADFVSHTNPPGLPEGVEGVRRFFAMFAEAIPDADVTIDELIVDGDRAAVATTITGTHTGELLGLAPTGRRVEVVGVDVVRVRDGRIVEHRGLTDTVGLMRQLGLGAPA